MKVKTENRYLIFDSPHKQNLKNFLKLIYYFCLSIKYSVFYSLNKPKNNKEKEYKVSILAIFKNESRYLKEWIEFHRIVGVDHFFLYNNNSDDDYFRILEPYIEDGTVTLVQWSKNQAQMECYQDGVERFKNRTEWMAIIDIDEFIVPNATDNIYDFLKKFNNCPSVIIYWKMFGTSGLSDREKDSLVIEDFTVSWRKYSDIGKCFYNTKFDVVKDITQNSCMHHFLWTEFKHKKVPAINLFGKICVPTYNPIPSYADKDNFPIQINHYFTKSFAEFADKSSKGDVYYKKNPHTLDYFYEHEMKSQATDYHAYKYLIKLKMSMGLID